MPQAKEGAAVNNPVVIRCSLLVLLGAAAPMLWAEDVKETVHLVVTGGPNAGKWDASTAKGGCTYGYAGPGSWGNQLSSPADKDPKHFNSLQLIVPDAKAASGGTKEFYLAVGFGPLTNRGAEYIVETRPAEKKKTGSGTVTVKDGGATATVSFALTTAEGIRLEGTIDCRQVLRKGA